MTKITLINVFDAIIVIDYSFKTVLHQTYL